MKTSEKLKVKSEKYASEKGITLITLIITIIIMLILVGVTVDIAVDGKLVDSAKGAVTKTNNKVEEHQNRIDELIGELDNVIDTENDEEEVIEVRRLNVETSTSQGQNLWNSTVTFNLSIEDEDITDVTLDQMREIAAYSLDFSNYAEFKSFVINFGGGEYTYEQIIEQYEFESEEEFLAYIIESMLPLLSFRDINKLESMGIKVISVETPYGTTLHTISGGTLQCTFVENGTYSFKIKSGETETTKTVQINNIRNYDKQGPHDIKIDFSFNNNGWGLEYSIDSTEEWNELASGVLSCNQSISFNMIDHEWTNYVVKDKNYYKYFIDDELWFLYIDGDHWWHLRMAYEGSETSSRQAYFLFNVMLGGGSSDFTMQGAGRFFDYLNDLFKSSYIDDGIIPESIISLYPEAGIGNLKFINEVSDIKTITFVSDTYIGVNHHSLT